MSYNFNKKQKRQLPNIIDTLLKLDNTQIELLSDNILVNLTNEQLKLIETAPNVNYELILKLRYIDQKDFIKKFSNTNRHDYWRKINQVLDTNYKLY